MIFQIKVTCQMPRINPWLFLFLAVKLIKKNELRKYLGRYLRLFVDFQNIIFSYLYVICL